MPAGSEPRRTNLWWRLVRFGFALLYHQLAWTYDAVAWLVSFGKWRAWGRTALPHLAGEKVLELGHGPGHLLVTLASQGFEPVGLDLSPHMSRLARKRLRGLGLAGLPLVRAPAQELPFVASTFDSVVAAFPTPFIVQPDTLAEIARVLRPAGRLVIVAGAQLTGRDPLSRFVEWLYRITGQREIPAGDTWLEPFVQAGFSVRTIWVNPNPAAPIGQSRVFLLLADLEEPPSD